MTKKRQHSGSKKRSVAELCAPSAEDQDINEFCSAVRLEEISFECWQKHHSTLDLQYPLCLSRSQLSPSFRTVIRLTRTIIITSPSGRRVETRERIEHELEITAQHAQQSLIKIPQLGDRMDEEVGDLVIILRISE